MSKDEVCPRCKTALQIAPGIGPYCPNKECPVSDGPALYKEAQQIGIAPTGVSVYVQFFPDKDRFMIVMEDEDGASLGDLMFPSEATMLAEMLMKAAQAAKAR